MRKAEVQEVLAQTREWQTQGLLPESPRLTCTWYFAPVKRMRKALQAGRNPVWSRCLSRHQGLPSNYIITCPLAPGTHLCLLGVSKGSWEVSSLHFHECALPAWDFQQFATLPKGRILSPCEPERGKEKKAVDTTGYWLVIKTCHKNPFYFF